MGKVTLKITLKYEPRADGKRNVRLRITAERKSRFVSTSIDIHPTVFNPKGKRENINWIKTAHPNAGVYNDQIKRLWDRAVALVDTFQNISADEVKSLIEESEKIVIVPAPERPGFRAYAAMYINRRGESATSETYENADKAFGKYLATMGKQDIAFEEITISFLKEWRQWALDHYKNNTVWLYHSRLKSLYFQAVEDIDGLSGLPTVVTEPFRRVKIPKIKTKKKRLYEDEITRFAALDLPWGTPMRRARDISLMMYYAQGMRVGDALRLRQRNYVLIGSGETTEHRLIYTMHKTGKAKNVLLPQQCVDLLLPYRQACSTSEQTLFTYLRKEIDMGYTLYAMRNKIKAKVVLIRNNLHKLMELAGIDKAVSAHVFRHSFADLARRSGMDWSKIKDAMSHENFSTTQDYMEELAESAVDEAAQLFK
ncbi:hypothetical protein GCM10027085_46360 [Spirosoma aerophilum]